MATWIKTDGTEETVKPSGKKFTLAELQKYVGGYIELVKTTKPCRNMWVNEEGMIHNLPRNAKATSLAAPGYLVIDGIRGDVLVCEKGES